MTSVPYLILIFINLVAFAMPYVVDFGDFNNFESFLRLGWKDNQDIKDGEWYRLITSIFLHGDIFHLLFNMYALFQLGEYSLAILGQINPVLAVALFVSVYFISGICGSLASFFFNPNPSVGASGAIFGLVGLILAIGLLSGSVGLAVNMLIFAVINFVYGFVLPKIDNFGHLGGLVAGFLCGVAIVFLR